jgi:hypothetical protein
LQLVKVKKQILNKATDTKQTNSVVWVRPSDRRVPAKLVPTFPDRGVPRG